MRLLFKIITLLLIGTFTVQLVTPVLDQLEVEVYTDLSEKEIEQEEDAEDDVKLMTHMANQSKANTFHFISQEAFTYPWYDEDEVSTPPPEYS